ncbi:MAG: SDR family oxidoreductase [Candidatus Algichlamydia australiensis]|nr:SDR family oxidoreductase [Chlamydiales bacterium]
MSSLLNKTIIITGGSRGIGLAIAKKLASRGANIAILSNELDSSIEEIENRAFGLEIDVSDENALKSAVLDVVKKFHGVDALINNTSATHFGDTPHTSPEQFDKLISTSTRAAFFLSQACLPYLEKASNPHIINISPPLNLAPRWFKNHLAFSLSKYAMSLCTLGMAEEFREKKIAVNSLWPETTIATQTIKAHFSDEVYTRSRWPTIMADAAYTLLQKNSFECSGNFFTDEALLQKEGVTDFSSYAVQPNTSLMQALFVSEENRNSPISQDQFLKKPLNK